MAYGAGDSGGSRGSGYGGGGHSGSGYGADREGRNASMSDLGASLASSLGSLGIGGGWGSGSVSGIGSGLSGGFGGGYGTDGVSRGLMSVADQARYDAGLRQGPFGGWYDTPASIGPVGFNNRGVDYGTRTAGAQAAYTAGKKADSMAKRDAKRDSLAALHAAIAADPNISETNRVRAADAVNYGDIGTLSALGVDQGLLGNMISAHKNDGLFGGLFSDDKPTDVNTIAEQEAAMLSKGWATVDPVTGDLVTPEATVRGVLGILAPMAPQFATPVAESIYGATESVPAGMAAKYGMTNVAPRTSSLGSTYGIGLAGDALGVPGLGMAAGLLGRASAMQDAGVVAPDRSNISSHASQDGGNKTTWADYANMALMQNPMVSPGQSWNRYMLYG